MKFLDAKALLADFHGGEPWPLMVAMSGTPGALPFFLRAEAARRGRDAALATLPFNTLQQHLLAAPPDGPELLLLLPWDWLPAADWRSGLPAAELAFVPLLDTAQATAERIRARLEGTQNVLFHLPAPIPPLLRHSAENERLQSELNRLAHELGARLLPESAFSLGNYLTIGSPFDNERIGEVAERLIGALLPSGGGKVLVTDLDNVAWRGVIGEDGIDGIQYRPEGAGYPHFIYQSLLARLRRDGVLIAAVSRNDADLARLPFQRGTMPLKEEDLVAVVADYQPKSRQIEMLAEQMSLGLDSFVFVDDNPVEIAEVAARLPQIHCLPFPAHIEALPPFLDTLARHFSRTDVTDEDRRRTALYRTRMAGLVARQGSGADLGAFLRDLRMRLTIADRSRGERTRAVQLINKTNQFNLNGRRRSDEEVAAILDDGGRLYVASLEDRHGAHGEILACLLDGRGVVRTLVMSCRVLQRRVEHAFMAWLSGQCAEPLQLDFQRTERNEPVRQFLQDPHCLAEGDTLRLGPGYASAHAGDLALFKLAVVEE